MEIYEWLRFDGLNEETVNVWSINLLYRYISRIKILQY
jgi:hypothetical protein